ncbi:hypothetical protein F2Q69_00012471 [Brassica cretica]|uniref:Uncharacterized protein n=1 Tax=Brassica cretica TaxID=69181 RepID=A0A8S9QYW0_BRACR|nr:hypothetical protein F2Q69_00012471 [Brassica cretica]
MLNRNPIKEIHITESSSAQNYYDFASNMPDDAHELINRKALHERLRNKIFFYQSIILSKYGRKAEKTAKATCLPFKKLKGQGSLNLFFNPHTIYFFHRHVQVNNKAGKLHVLPTLIHHNDYQRGVQLDFNINDNKAHENFQTYAFRLNSAKQTFPIPFLPNWTYYPIDY